MRECASAAGGLAEGALAHSASALDLRRPDNIRQTVEYDDSANVYYVGSKMNGSYLNAPVLMTPEEYRKWSEKRLLRDFFRQKNAENVQNKGKEKFSFLVGCASRLRERQS